MTTTLESRSALWLLGLFSIGVYVFQFAPIVDHRGPTWLRQPARPSTRRTGMIFSEIMYHPRERADGASQRCRGPAPVRDHRRDERTRGDRVEHQGKHHRPLRRIVTRLGAPALPAPPSSRRSTASSRRGMRRSITVSLPAPLGAEMMTRSPFPSICSVTRPPRRAVSSRWARPASQGTPAGQARAAR